MKEKEKKKPGKLKKAAKPKKASPATEKKKAVSSSAARASVKRAADVKKKSGARPANEKSAVSPKAGAGTKEARKKTLPQKPGRTGGTEDVLIGGLGFELEDEIVNEDGTVTLLRHDDGGAITGTEEFLMFRFSGEGYSLRVSDVDEILKHQSITSVPGSAGYVMGITSLRGTMVPVLSLGSLLSLQDSEPPDNGRILVLNGNGVIIGLLVEKRIGIVRFENVKLLPPMHGKGGYDELFVEGVLDAGGEFFTVLSPDAITRTKATGRLNETEA